MSKISTLPADKSIFEEADLQQEKSLELDQQMIWVQIRKTVPATWLLVTVAVWLTSCFAYFWESMIVNTIAINANVLWLVSGFFLPLMHYVAMGVLPFTAKRLGRSLATPINIAKLSWRFYGFVILASCIFLAMWSALLAFNVGVDIRAVGYLLMSAIISLILVGFRRHYQQSIQLDY
ncbi:hypothetical protein [Thalassotalea sp. PS06]|uniref:hypothetical protein n=1 Tax=Thalassotalea sp. PS06 TaxID=2594005 RepID=UPI00116246D4|nr:hypothetical protein [Thalassotalea sp. PS06]QDP00518.1 hypothetical protein FNC98_03605 [Thalassotalea sp. PS06]